MGGVDVDVVDVVDVLVVLLVVLDVVEGIVVLDVVVAATEVVDSAVAGAESDGPRRSRMNTAPTMATMSSATAVLTTIFLFTVKMEVVGMPAFRRGHDRCTRRLGRPAMR